MRIKYGLLIVFLFLFCKLFALDPQFSFFPWTQPYYNAGSMGEKEKHLNFIGVLRQGNMFMYTNPPQTPDETNDSGANPPPETEPREYKDQQEILLNIDSYIKQIRGAIGVMFLKDKVGNQDNIGFRFGYATKFRVRGGKLGIGVQFGFLNRKFGTDYIFHVSPDPTVPTSSEEGSYMDFDLNFGLHYKAPTWYVGISGTQLIGGVHISGAEEKPLTRQFYISGGYIWNLNTAIPWSIEPSVLIHTDFAVFHWHLMALARYNGILWFGVSYQLTNGFAALFGATPFYNNTNEYLKGLEIGLAYTFQTTKFAYKGGGGSMGDFELIIRYGFNFYKEKVLTGYGSSRHLYKNQY